MYLHKKRRLKRRKNGKGIALVCIVLAVIVVFVAIIDLRLKPIIRIYAENIVDRLCLGAINSAADRAIVQSGLTYSDIVTIERNENNAVTAVMADVASVNKIKTIVTDELLCALDRVDDEKIAVPLGTVLGSNLLLGRGPDIKVRVELTGSSEVEVDSIFESVGINQTRHSVVLNIRCKVYVVMLGSESMLELSVSVPVAETIIIGTVPDTYLSLS